MTTTRAVRRFVCEVMLGVLVFCQMAIAAYPCPALSGSPQSHLISAMTAPAASLPEEAGASMAVWSDTSDMAAMVGCNQIDDSAVNLCTEHCRFGQQSADHASVPIVSAALLTVLYPSPVQLEPLGRDWPLANSKFKHVGASPPHAILHCCFRI